ncbi:MAG TPA: hypothetical protein VMS18_13680 [Candidatus Binatia bacterium]|nr:hypothetical protein [Candidatus Binatia bacterium]
MSSYPDRCQHLRTNGMQCGSPALRRNRFCYFHKRYQDERIRLTADRRRRGAATFFLPVLEDANSIQMSLMQIMRLLLTGQIEHKTASLLLYALQTASTNLRQANFKPFVHEVILDPRDAAQSPLDESNLWNDDDFEEEDEEEVDEVEREIEEKAEEAARKARYVARWEAKKEIEARERARKRYEEDEKLKLYVEQHPDFMLVRENGRLKLVQRQPEAPQPAKPAPEQPEKKPAASTSTAQVREKINDMIRQNLPELTQAYNEALKKEADKQATKKQPEKETLSTPAKNAKDGQ